MTLDTAGIGEGELKTGIAALRRKANFTFPVHQKHLTNSALIGDVIQDALNFDQVLGQHRMLQTADDDIAQVGGREIEVGDQEIALANVLEQRERAEDDKQRNRNPDRDFETQTGKKLLGAHPLRPLARVTGSLDCCEVKMLGTL
jgi:hypothetical protein